MAINITDAGPRINKREDAHYGIITSTISLGICIAVVQINEIQ